MPTTKQLECDQWKASQLESKTIQWFNTWNKTSTYTKPMKEWMKEWMNTDVLPSKQLCICGSSF